MEFPSLKTIKIWSGFWSKLFHLQWISWNLKTIYNLLHYYFPRDEIDERLKTKSPVAAWACPAKPNGWTISDRWPKSGLRGMGLREVEWTTQWFSTRSTIWKAERSFWRLVWTTWWRRFRRQRAWPQVPLPSPPMPCRHLKSSSRCSRGWRAWGSQSRNPSFIAMT